MRILVTSIVDLHKGPHTRLHEFIKYLKGRHEFTVLSVNDWWKAGQTASGSYARGVDDLSERVHTEYFTQWRISPILQEVMSGIFIDRLLEKVNYRTFDVHFNYNSLISGYFVARKLRTAGIRTILDIADDLPQMIGVSPQIPSIARPAGKLIGKLMLSRNIRLASKTTFVDTHIQALYSSPPGSGLVVSNGVDAELFSPRPAKPVRERLGIGENFVVGFVGTLREWVDFEPVFAAVSQLSTRCPDMKILIVGEEGGLARTAKSARKFGVLDRTIFAGTVPYSLVPDYVSCMDVCLIPFSRGMGMDAGEDGACPLKLAEYLACEKPVISTQKTSMPEGLVQYVSDSDGYRDKILTMYNSPELRKEIGTKGRSVVLQSHTWSKSASTLEKTISEVASQVRG